MDTFVAAVKKFNQVLQNVDKSDAIAARKMNDKLMLLERFFVDPRGLPNHPETKSDIIIVVIVLLHN